MPESMSPSAPGESILLVDDDPEMRALLRDFLTGAGFRVEEAADTGALFTLLPRGEPTAIILDHEMPGDWGLEVLPTLRARWPQVPVVIITAFGGPRLRAEAQRLGAAAYLDKPFRVSELLSVLRLALTPAPACADPAPPARG